MAKNNRVVQRRQRVCVLSFLPVKCYSYCYPLISCMKDDAKGQEVSVMESLEKYMTDEETDSEDSTALVKRSLPWRSTKCAQFLKKT